MDTVLFVLYIPLVAGLALWVGHRVGWYRGRLELEAEVLESPSYEDVRCRLYHLRKDGKL